MQSLSEEKINISVILTSYMNMKKKRELFQYFGRVKCLGLSVTSYGPVQILCGS